MRCPICKVDMIVVEYQKIELDYCTQCSGVWFDSGELELFLHSLLGTGGSLSQSDLLSTPDVKLNERKRKCPICGRKMDKAFAGKEPEVLVDVCPRGEGLWFDGGEMEQLAKQVSKSPGKKGSQDIVSFLGDVFQATGRLEASG